MGAFAAKRKKRHKQVNVRLSELDARKFSEIMDRMMHQTASESVRELIRSGFLQLTKLSQNDVNNVMTNLPPDASEDDATSSQLNVRLNQNEVEMMDKLIAMMHCGNTSSAIRSLIRIYHYSMTE